MGYRITQAYFDRAPDKRPAITDILSIRDFDAFLTASGYRPTPIARRASLTSGS
jgi:hypothetical protein